ncbi:MAG: alpha/beta hydrolase [Paracoccaceae bacterium]
MARIVARTGTANQALPCGAGGLLDVLSKDDHGAFQEILRAIPKTSSASTPTFIGHPYFITSFEIKDGETLDFVETPSPQIAQTLATVRDVGSFSAQGTMTDGYVIICFGLANWAGRLLAIANAAFDGFLDLEWPGAKVPPAEKRMLRQLLIGQLAGQAAQIDAVAYETKRTYVKQLCRRLNVSGQVELVSAVLGRLLIAINAMTADDIPKDNPDPLTIYRRDFMPDCSRVLQLLDGHGERNKILDIGPQTGRPVLFAHPTILPFFSNDIGARLTQLNLRLLLPLRPGAFDPHAKVLPAQEYAKRAVEGLALCKSLLAGRDAPVLGLSTDGSWAVRFAQSHPQLTPKLFLASMTFQAPQDGSLFGQFLSSFSMLVAERPALLNVYVEFMLRRHKTPARFREMNAKVFPPDTVDGQAMAWEFSQRGAIEAYMHFYHASPAYLKSDGHPNFYVAPQDIAALSSSVHLIHGSDNARDDVATLQELAAGNSNIRLKELAGAGHVLRGTTLATVWRVIANSN